MYLMLKCMFHLLVIKYLLYNCIKRRPNMKKWLTLPKWISFIFYIRTLCIHVSLYRFGNPMKIFDVIVCIPQIESNSSFWCVGQWNEKYVRCGFLARFTYVFFYWWCESACKGCLNLLKTRQERKKRHLKNLRLLIIATVISIGSQPPNISKNSLDHLEIPQMFDNFEW